MITPDQVIKRIRDAYKQTGENPQDQPSAGFLRSLLKIEEETGVPLITINNMWADIRQTLIRVAEAADNATTTSAPTPATTPQMATATSPLAPVSLGAATAPETVAQVRANVPAEASKDAAGTFPFADPLQPETAQDPYPKFPAGLKALDRWVGYDLVWNEKKGKYDKPPLNIQTGFTCSAHDKANQFSYADAAKAVAGKKFSGAGFDINHEDGLTCTDFDGCVNPETLEIRADVKRVVEETNSYAEYSPSRTGVHLWTRGWQVPIEGDKQGCKVGSAEMYSGRRYMTVTGDHVPGTPLTVESRDLSALHRRVLAGEFPSKNPATATTAIATTGSTNGAASAVGIVVEDKTDKSPSGDEYHLILDLIKEMPNSTADELDAEFRKRHVDLYRPKWDAGRNYIKYSIERALNNLRVQSQVPVVTAAPSTTVPSVSSAAQAQADAAAEASKGVTGVFPNPADSIPPLDDSMLIGTIKKFTDAMCSGTTIPRQYGAHAAKVVMNAVITTHKVKLEDCNSTHPYYILFGDSGAGKGETIKRFNAIMDCFMGTPIMYRTTSIDSEAGLRDAFFDIPENKNAPLVFTVEEIKTLGQKADGKKNPEIVSGIIEMANSDTVSRAKAKKRGEKTLKTRKDCWLMLFACAQDGETYATAFPRTKKQGINDRFVPEFSTKVEPGSLPDPDTDLGAEAILEAIGYAVKLKNGMCMSADVRDQVGAIWKTQTEEIRKSPRLRQHLLLEMYLAAFARGSAVAETQDLAIALKWFERQNAIRSVEFSEEIPDQVGVYIQKLRHTLEDMLRELRKGKDRGEVAQSFRDLATDCGAYKDNDLPTFKRAWDSMIPWMVEVKVKEANGHTYMKVLPMPGPTDTWFPADKELVTPKKSY